MGGGTITLKNDPAQIRKAFEYAKAGGFPLIVAAPEPAALDAIETAIKEFDIKVAIHNHGPEDKFFPAPQDAYKLLKGRDKRFGLCMDIGHTARAGVDPVKTVDECQDRLLDVHVKDLKDKTNKESQTEVGKGALDIPGLFRALLQDQLPRTRRPRVRDQRRGPACRDPGVVLLHARGAGHVVALK